MNRHARRVAAATQFFAPPDLETIPQSAHELNVGRSTIYKLVTEQKLKLVKIGRAARIVRESREAYIRSLVEAA